MLACVHFYLPSVYHTYFVSPELLNHFGRCLSLRVCLVSGVSDCPCRLSGALNADPKLPLDSSVRMFLWGRLTIPISRYFLLGWSVSKEIPSHSWWEVPVCLPVRLWLRAGRGRRAAPLSSGRHSTQLSPGSPSLSSPAFSLLH